jgi:excisionase family DNA binding protein
MIEILSVRELADRLKVDRLTVYRWSSSGILPSLKIGGTLRFSGPAIDAFLKKLESGAAAAPTTATADRAEA